MKTLGEKIRELRESKDMSLREFARLLGDLSAAFVSDVELGRRFPSEKVLAKMAGILDVKTEELIKFDLRPKVDELKRRAAADPAYAVMLRTIAEKRIDPQDITNYINRSEDKKKR